MEKREVCSLGVRMTRIYSVLILTMMGRKFTSRNKINKIHNSFNVRNSYVTIYEGQGQSQVKGDSEYWYGDR